MFVGAAVIVVALHLTSTFDSRMKGCLYDSERIARHACAIPNALVADIIIRAWPDYPAAKLFHLATAIKVDPNSPPLFSLSLLVLLSLSYLVALPLLPSPRALNKRVPRE